MKCARKCAQERVTKLSHCLIVVLQLLVHHNNTLTRKSFLFYIFSVAPSNKQYLLFGKHINRENCWQKHCKKAIKNFQNVEKHFWQRLSKCILLHASSMHNDQLMHLSTRCQKRFLNTLVCKNGSKKTRKWGRETLVLVFVAYIGILFPPKNTYSSAPFSMRQ